MPDSPNKLSQFWQELKRRRVVHVIVVYATASYVIIELVGNVYETLNLPDWTPALILIILSIGFPIALIFSWIFDVTPGGIEKTKPSKEVRKEEKTSTPNSWKIATYVSFAVIIGLLALNIFGSRNQTKIDESLEKSIAVLPFLNLSGDPNQDFICEGLTDEIINQLYKIESFGRIPSLNSVKRYKDTDKSTNEISKELGVNYILECSYKKMDGLLRFTVLLKESKSDMQIWHHDYDKQNKVISSIPSDIALRIAEHLRAFLTDPEKQSIQKIPTSNQEAYLKYVQGNNYYRRGYKEQDLYTAINLLKDAVTLDPAFGLAYSALARCYMQAYWFLYDHSQFPLNESKKAIETALSIDPDLPEAYIAKADYYYHGKLDYPKALEQLQLASIYMPNHSEIKSLTALVYRRMGRWEDAIEEFEKALMVDPVSQILLYNIGETHYWMGKYPKAIEYFNRIIMIDPENSGGYAQKIHTYLLRDGNTIKAREVIAEAALNNIPMNELTDAFYTSPLMLNIYDEKYQKALDFLHTTEWEGQVNLLRCYPKSLFKARIYNLSSIPDKAKSCYDSARVQLESMLLENPDNPRILSTLGIVYATLGEKAKAVSLGRKAVELYSMDKDAFTGILRIEELAWIYTLVEEYDKALEQIEIFLSNPSPFSIMLLQLDPKWKPLWDHPDFIRLTEKYAKK